MRTPSSPDALPNPFFASRQDRVALARERYFEDGEHPSGLVSEPVLQSWARCLRAGRSPNERIVFDPISKIRISTLMTKNRALLEAAKELVAELEVAIAGSQTRAMLTSSEGVVLQVSRATGAEGPIMKSTRVGVPIGETAIGTAAPGVAIQTGDLGIVRGGEHFFRCLAPLECAAVPVHDASGRIAAFLNLTSEAAPLRFDAGAMARIYATCIENRLLVNSARSQLLLRFQSSKNLFHTPLEGLAAVDENGVVRWFNGVGARLFSYERVPVQSLSSEEVFGLEVGDLLNSARDGQARLRTLPSGLALWLEVRLDLQHSSAEVSALEVSEVIEAPRPAEPLPSLAEVNRGTIEQALTQSRGNISRAARTLGVSRGLLYRRLRDWKND